MQGSHASGILRQPSTFRQPSPHPTLSFLSCLTHLHISGWLRDLPLTQLISDKGRTSVSTPSRPMWTARIPKHSIYLSQLQPVSTIAWNSKSEGMGWLPLDPWPSLPSNKPYVLLYATLLRWQIGDHGGKFWKIYRSLCWWSTGDFQWMKILGSRATEHWQRPVTTASAGSPHALSLNDGPYVRPLCPLYLQAQPVPWNAHTVSCLNPDISSSIVLGTTFCFCD